MSILSTIETDAEKVLSWLTKEGTKIETAGPTVIAGLGVLLGGVEKALADVSAATANPTSLLLNLGSDINDIKAVWPDIKAFAATLGIKI